MIDDEKLIALDIETSNGVSEGSLDPRQEGSVIALVQLGYEDGTLEHYRWNEDTKALLQKLIDEDHRFVCHNAAFEMDWFLVKAGIRFKKIWCTMVGSQILNAGKLDVDAATAISGRSETKNMDYVGNWNPLLHENDENIGTQKNKGKFSHSYQATVHRYARGIRVEKDQGNSNWLQEPLSPEQLRYALEDVKYLIEIAKHQWEFMKRFKLTRVAELEMGVAIAVNEMKLRGIKINPEKWRESALEHAQRAKELEDKLNPALGLELAEREKQRTLFGSFIPKSFKVSSPAQLASFFGLENADESILRSVDHPLIRDILTYKENSKIASTYGDKYLSHIREDGRIHSALDQADTATGRFKSKKPALQTIPPVMLKAFLDCDDDYLLVFADYSAMESRILAYAANDSNFIGSVNAQDVHWENAKKIFKLPENASRGDRFHVESLDRELTGEELRRVSKGLSFGIPYGISAVGLVNRGFADNADQAQDLLDEFFRNYPQVHKFLKSSVAEALTRGYTQDPFGRIRWYEIPTKASEEEIRQATSRAARQAQNHKIQSMSANITKQAIVDLYNYFQETQYGYMILTIHDSILFEIKRQHMDEAISKIVEFMEAAGPKVFPGMIVPVDIDVGHKEKRRCRITGLEFSVYSELFKSGKVVKNDTWVEPRVSKLLSGFNINDYSGGIVRLAEIIRTKSPDWHKENKDIVAAVSAAHSRN